MKKEKLKIPQSLKDAVKLRDEAMNQFTIYDDEIFDFCIQNNLKYDLEDILSGVAKISYEIISDEQYRLIKKDNKQNDEGYIDIQSFINKMKELSK